MTRGDYLLRVAKQDDLYREVAAMYGSALESGICCKTLVFFAWIGKANRYAANHLQARIDALERDV